MGAAAPEARGLAGGEQTLQHRSVGLEDAAVEIGLYRAQALSGQDVQLDRDQRASLRIQDPVGLGDPR